MFKDIKYMKKLSLILFGFILTIALFAQTPIISFEKSTHDFGKIKEKDGIATVVFTLKNTGDAPLVINRVQAS